MTSVRVSLTVVGHPATKGSKDFMGMRRSSVTGRQVPILTESAGDKLTAWNRVVQAACAKMRRDVLFTTPVHIAEVYYIARPKKHYGTGRNAGTLKPSAPAYPATHDTGDIDKLQRALHDAITRKEGKVVGLLADDCLITDVNASKRWADHREPGADVTITVMPDPTEGDAT